MNRYHDQGNSFFFNLILFLIYSLYSIFHSLPLQSTLWMFHIPHILLTSHPTWPLNSLGTPATRVRCIISEWTQTQKSTICVLGALYQLVFAVCLQVPCLRDLRGPDYLRLLVLLQDCPSSQILSSFPNSTTGDSWFCPLVGCKYLHLTFQLLVGSTGVQSG